MTRTLIALLLLGGCKAATAPRPNPEKQKPPCRSTGTCTSSLPKPPNMPLDFGRLTGHVRGVHSSQATTEKPGATQ